MQSRSLLFAERVSCYLLIWQLFTKWLDCQNCSNLNTLSKLLYTQEQDAGVGLLKSNMGWRLTSAWQIHVPGAHQTFTALRQCWWRAYSSGFIIAWVTSGDMQLGLSCFLGDEFIFTIFEWNPLMQSGKILAYASDFSRLIFLVHLVFGDKSVINCTQPRVILWSSFLDFCSCWLCSSAVPSWWM